MTNLKTSLFAVAATVAALAFAGVATNATAAPAVSPSTMAKIAAAGLVTDDTGADVQATLVSSHRDGRRGETRSRRGERSESRRSSRRSETRSRRGHRTETRRSERRGVTRYDRRRHGERHRTRRPGFTYYHGGYYYAWPWWTFGIVVAPGYGGTCSYWHNQCVANWGYANPNYYGCMRYHGCW